ETGPPGLKSHAFTLIVIVWMPGEGVGVGGLNPGGAGTSFAPTTRIRSPDLLSASAAYVKSGLAGSLESTGAWPLVLARLPNPTTPYIVLTCVTPWPGRATLVEPRRTGPSKRRIVAVTELALGL